MLTKQQSLDIHQNSTKIFKYKDWILIDFGEAKQKLLETKYKINYLNHVDPLKHRYFGQLDQSGTLKELSPLIESGPDQYDFQNRYSLIFELNSNNNIIEVKEQYHCENILFTFHQLPHNDQSKLYQQLINKEITLIIENSRKPKYLFETDEYYLYINKYRSDYCDYRIDLYLKKDGTLIETSRMEQNTKVSNQIRITWNNHNDVITFKVSDTEGIWYRSYEHPTKLIMHNVKNIITIENEQLKTIIQTDQQSNNIDQNEHLVNLVKYLETNDLFN